MNEITSVSLKHEKIRKNLNYRILMQIRDEMIRDPALAMAEYGIHPADVDLLRDGDVEDLKAIADRMTSPIFKLKPISALQQGYGVNMVVFHEMRDAENA
ncbi:hypothetical protein [Iodobacter fluviatilis]|uniref:Uncharacterized protein n=1 Tax=Iodobacter fluviatilis TaxID=537 RepID=A0A377Q436_9NEIS|nr:hypothetical protein [Iodobacter fluviatilis]TCU84518.1 hypothetical protein EV682_10943 [Iodobacter fluviatilis]STQ89984.1 Uncharacterised protein [Iodobacter fluviatilis]